MLAVPGCLSFLHVGIGHGMQRYEGLLHRLSRGPLQHVVRAPGLVVGPGQPGATEGLLSHHGACGLVVDVEVPGRSLQQLSGLVSKLPGGKMKY